MFLRRQHEDGEDEHGGEEHLDEEAAHDGGGAQRRADLHRGGEERGHDAGGGDAREDFGEEDERAADPADGADEAHAEGYLGGGGGLEGGMGSVWWELRTAGLKRPPEMRKKTQMLAASEKPKPRAMKSKSDVFGVSDVELLAAAVFATCAAERAKKRNMNVPTNSPSMAMKWFLARCGIQLVPGSRGPRLSSSVTVGFLCHPGITMYCSEGWLMFMIVNQEV